MLQVVKKLLAVVIAASILYGCGNDSAGAEEQQVNTCITRGANGDVVVPIEKCQKAEETGTTKVVVENNNNNGGDASLLEYWLAYQLIRGPWSYPSYGTRYVVVDSTRFVSPADKFVVKQYGGIKTKPVSPPKTSPINPTTPKLATAPKHPAKSPSEPPAKAPTPKPPAPKPPSPKIGK